MLPSRVGSGFRGTTGLRCLVRQVPHLANKRPGVERFSSNPHSLSSVPDTRGRVSHQSPWWLQVTHPEQACSPASSLGKKQVFVPESGSCPRGPEPSGRLLVKTETQVRGMFAEPSCGGSDLGKIWHGRGGHLCVAGVDPMPTLVLPLSPCLSGDRCTSAPLAGHEAVCFPSGQGSSEQCCAG